MNPHKKVKRIKNTKLPMVSPNGPQTMWHACNTMFHQRIMQWAPKLALEHVPRYHQNRKMRMMMMMESMPAVATKRRMKQKKERKKQGQFTNHMVDPCVCHPIPQHASAHRSWGSQHSTIHFRIQIYTFQLHRSIPTSSNLFQSIIHPQVSSSGQKTNQAARQ